MDRRIRIARRVLDRPSDQAGLAGQANGRRAVLRRGAEPVLEVARNRKVRYERRRSRRQWPRSRPCRGPRRNPASPRERISRAGGRQRLGAQAGKQTRRTRVPRVGYDEGLAPVMQRLEALEPCPSDPT